MIHEYLYTTIIAPLYTEKCTAQTENGKYCFKVSGESTKLQIKKAIEKIFEIKVLKVNVLNCKGKKKIFKGRKGRRSDFKKAIVTLEKGKIIDFTMGVK